MFLIQCGFKYGGDAVEAGAVRRMASGQIQFLNDGKVFDVDVADFGKDKFYVVIVAKSNLISASSLLTG